MDWLFIKKKYRHSYHSKPTRTCVTDGMTKRIRLYDIRYGFVHIWFLLCIQLYTFIDFLYYTKLYECADTGCSVFNLIQKYSVLAIDYWLMIIDLSKRGMLLKCVQLWYLIREKDGIGSWIISVELMTLWWNLDYNCEESRLENEMKLGRIWKCMCIVWISFTLFIV